MQVWGWLLLDVVVSVLGCVSSKRWSTNGGLAPLAMTFALYNVAIIAWLQMLRAGDNELARMGILCDVSNAAAVVALGLVVYRESLSPPHVVGLALAFAAVILLSR